MALVTTNASHVFLGRSRQHLASRTLVRQAHQTSKMALIKVYIYKPSSSGAKRLSCSVFSSTVAHLGAALFPTQHDGLLLLLLSFHGAQSVRTERDEVIRDWRDEQDPEENLHCFRRVCAFCAHGDPFGVKAVPGDPV